MDNQETDLTVPLGFALITFLAVGFLMWTSAHATSFLGDGIPLLDDIPTSQAVIDTIRTPSTPDIAWGDPSIGHPAIFWTIFIAQLLAIIATSTFIFNKFRSRDFGLSERSRLKADTEAQLAKMSDLKPLHVKDFVPDRFSLGRKGRQYLAAENRRSKYDPGPQTTRGDRDAGDRGPVMFVGPTRSGKTVGVISGILTWHGPMIAASIKDDLIRPTLANRRLLGETAVFDPTETLRKSYAASQLRHQKTKDPNDAPPAAWDPRLCINWSPLATIKDFDDALRIADSIADAAPSPTSGDSGKSDFWMKSAKQILSPLLYLAALTGKDFDTVVDWCISPPDPTAISPYAGYFNQIRSGLPAKQHKSVDRVEDRLDQTLGTSDVQTSLHDVYSTLRTIVDPWFSDRLSASASGKSVDLEWLVGGGHENPRSFYLAAPPHEAKRLQAVFGGCINELIRQVYTHVESHGPIEPPLLIVLDEAANMPLPLLSSYVSSLAGLGVQLVTVFQDFGQINGAYGHSVGGSIINNHTSRLFFRRQTEQDTTKWIENATGSEEVDTTSSSINDRGTSSTRDSKRLALLPSNVVREQPKLEALLIHGGLKPAHIQTHTWYSSKKLQALAEWPKDVDQNRGLPYPTATNQRTGRPPNPNSLFATPAKSSPPPTAASTQPMSLLSVIPPKTSAPPAQPNPTPPTPTSAAKAPLPTPNENQKSKRTTIKDAFEI